jgi:glycosyltransferase involved in cell wall biosynthesis
MKAKLRIQVNVTKGFDSIIIPSYNEQRTIGMLLEAILNQSFPVDDLEVVIADGISTDGTRKVIDTFRHENQELSITLVDNPKRIIPAGLNVALERATGDFIIRLDAHSIPEPNYVALCIEAIDKTGAANVGGAWEIMPSGDGWIARSIAIAASHQLGAGDARYRYKGDAGEVHTVPFGSFQRTWIEKVGAFNESLLSNEDYEYNYRLRMAGGKIWFDPAIKSIYFARKDLGQLMVQYLRYGYWKAMMLAQNPKSLRWRQALPAGFVLGLIALSVLALVLPSSRILLAAYLGVYAGITIGFGMVEAVRNRDLAILLGFPLALWTMHLAWGIAFFGGIIGWILGRLRGGS